jgi:hypothetical protein
VVMAFSSAHEPRRRRDAELNGLSVSAFPRLCDPWPV